MWIKLSKLFYILLVLYYGWFQEVFVKIPNALLALGGGMIGCIILHSLQKRTNILNSMTSELLVWLIFAITSLLFGMLVAINEDYLISSISTFFQFIFLMFGIVYISRHDKNIDFSINVFILYASICAITTIFWGYTYQGRMSMSPTDNPNNLGITMAIGLCCLLYKLNYKKTFNIIVSISLVLLLTYVCLLTGSRKSFISIILLLVYWLVFVILSEIRRLPYTEKLRGGMFVFIGIIIGYSILSPILGELVLFERLTLLLEGGSGVRESMYSVALDLFQQNPIIGIGFNNFRAATIFGTYSHSTYAEVLACTGLVGFVLYFLPWITLIFKYSKLLKLSTDTVQVKQTRLMFALFCILLFLGVGVIHFYSMTSSIALGMLIAFCCVNSKVVSHSRVIHTSNNVHTGSKWNQINAFK